jgi:hypothetical protein
MRAPGVCVGLDVSTAPMDVALRPTADGWHVSHEAPGRALLVERLQAIPPALIGGEATGGAGGSRGRGPRRGCPAGGGGAPPPRAGGRPRDGPVGHDGDP